MNTISLEEAQARLPEIIGRLRPGEEVIVLRRDKPIARIIAEPAKVRKPRQPGSGKDKILYMADDFDAPLADFKDYME